MAKGFKCGTGGAALNFRVVGGTVQPENPAKNTIWINTEAAITGWIFAAEDPALRESGELYNTEGGTEGVYLDSNGESVESSNFALITAPIALPENCHQIKVVSGDTSTSSVCHAFYDADGALLTTVLRGTGTTLYDVPEGAVSVSLSVRTDDAPSLTAVYRETKEGMVWIGTGKSSPVAFNALKKNGIEVYPISASQYVGGAWQTVTAMTYQDGAWAEWWDGYVYKAGDEYEDFTGGWESAWNTGSYYQNKGTVTKNEDNIKISTAGSTYSIYAKTVNKVNVTSFNTLSVVATSTHGKFGLSDGESWNEANDMVASASPKNGEASLDISELTGEYYVCMYIAAGNSNTYTEVKLS